MPVRKKSWLETSAGRKKTLEELGVFWHHDGNPKRPYVRLRSGLISNGYFNGAVLCELPAVLDAVSHELVSEMLDGDQSRKSLSINRVIGPAMGAITFAHSVASAYFKINDLAPQIKMAFAEKEGDAFAFKRNQPLPHEQILLVEDTITTGGSLVKVIDAVRAVAPSVQFSPNILALCNRSGKTHLGSMKIYALVDAELKTWEEGKNPFTKDGRELVPPVEKPKDDWKLLTQEY
ncbi:MAG: Orotate phosphoribosyltransferase [Parcubacteria bacterium C7867-001]|nr:MAG: Orotate phosphoribosyltransferase [Parcubacteria bacterium C7867-001]